MQEQTEKPSAQRNTQKWVMAWLCLIVGLSSPLWVDKAVIGAFLFFCGSVVGAAVGFSVGNNWAMKK